MQEVKFLCCVNDSLEHLPFHIILYNGKCQKVYDVCLSENTTLILQSNEVYKVVIVAPYGYQPSMICSSLYTNNNLKIIKFYFRNDILSIKINLVDEYYCLPISKGEIKLWQNPTQ